MSSSNNQPSIAGRVTTDDEKRQILDRLYTLWIKWPELRLGQLLLNAVREPSLYYSEDVDLMTKLEQFYAHVRAKYDAHETHQQIATEVEEGEFVVEIDEL